MKTKIYGMLLLVALGIIFTLTRKDKLDFPQHETFAAQISKCNKVVLYEGLPHQGGEHEEFQRELTNKAIISLADFLFTLNHCL